MKSAVILMSAVVSAYVLVILVLVLIVTATG
jgi:hypothetical protein